MPATEAHARRQPQGRPQVHRAQDGRGQAEVPRQRVPARPDRTRRRHPPSARPPRPAAAYLAFAKELDPAGEVGLALALHAARMSVRMERCADHENAMQVERVRKASAESEVPGGLDAAGLARLKAEVSDRAAFDASPEATLARKYEAAAERGFLRALREWRALERRQQAIEAELVGAEAGPFSPEEISDEEFDELCAEFGPAMPPGAAARPGSAGYGGREGGVDVPITVGRRR